ncbi:MAG: DUF4365 domain-containing protein [Patulibacter minatonensis]
MDLNKQKDLFSRALVRAVAATAGVRADVPEHDEDSEDMTFASSDTSDAPGRRLSAQLKCSQNITSDTADFQFPLPVKNYNDLRRTDVYIPRILIVVHVPNDPSDWLDPSPAQTLVRHCAYYVDLRGLAETANTSTVSVTIPTEQVFDPDALIRCLAPPGVSL